MEDSNKRKKVLCPVSGANNKTYWLRMGTAHVNKDNSINLYLDAIPLNGKLQVRDWDEQPWEQRRDGGGGAHDRDVPPPLVSVPMTPMQMAMPRLAPEVRTTDDTPF
jgi:hypothetical protein